MKKFLYIIIIFSISFYLSIEFIGDRLIKNKLEENISNSLNREVSIDKLDIKYLSESNIFDYKKPIKVINKGKTLLGIGFLNKDQTNIKPKLVLNAK